MLPRLLPRVAVAAFSVSLVAGALAAPEDDYKTGQDIGNASRARIVDDIKSGEAAKQQPTYNTDPPEKNALKGDMNAAAAAKKAECAKTPDEPQCIGMAIGSTARPKETIKPSEMLSGEAVARDPSLILNDIGKAYSACRVGDVKMIKPATFAPDACVTNTSAWSSQTCTKTLEVVPKDRYTCEQTKWIATTQSAFWAGAVGRTINTMADVQCDLVRSDGALDFAFGACADCPSAPVISVLSIDVSKPSPPADTLPPKLGTIVVKYGTAVDVYEDGAGCDETVCSKTLHFMVGEAVWIADEFGGRYEVGPTGFKWNYVCAAPTVHGPKVQWEQETCSGSGDSYSCSTSTVSGDEGVCFAPADASTSGAKFTTSPGGWYAPGPPATKSGYVPNAPGGYGKIVLSFKKPRFEKKAGEYWADACEPFAKRTPPALLPADGTNVPIALVMPSNLADQCQRVSSNCIDGPSTKVIDGIEVTRTCWAYENRFDCATLAPTSNCDLPKFRNCAPTGAPTCATTDTASPPHCLSVLTSLECRVSDPVYAPVADCGTTVFCSDGSCTGTGDPPDADFARSVAMLEAAKESGRTLDTKDLRVFKGQSGTCESWPTACCKPDPTDLARACNEEDKQIAVDRQAGKCHEVEAGWCASRTLGVCTRRMNTYCCFTSKLSRIINEQGRAQLGRSFGSGKNPDCSGFTVDDLALLDFSKMDFTEFMADIKPVLPNTSDVQNSSETKSGNCYYGEGKC